jgi:hypothetical protein
MPLQYAIAVSHDFLAPLLEFFARLPAPAIGALLIAVAVCLYESLGNSRLAPGKWR